MYSKLMVTAAFGLISSQVWADECVLKYAENENGYTITGKTGTCNTVTIPSEYNGKPVTSIGSRAFQDVKLQSLVIPESVTALGERVFLNAHIDNLEIKGANVTLGDGGLGTSVQNTKYNSITYSCGDNCIATMNNDGSAVFTGTGTLTSGAKPAGFGYYTSVYVNGFSEIGGYAFADTPIESIVISDTVTSIGSRAFQDVKLQSLVIPESVTALGENVFLNAHIGNIYCSEAQQDMCISAAGSNYKNVGSYKKKGKYILYYDYIGKLVNKGLNPSYKPKKIYTVEEAMEATKDGDKFHVFLTYK